MDEALFIRGRIIASYSQVEFLLADISVKLDLRFPYRIQDRIKAAKRIADREGYGAYKAELEAICDQLLVYDEIRHFMAHGFLTLTTDRKGNHQFEFLRYEREGEGKFNLLQGKTEVTRLRAAADDITEYTGRAIELFRRIYLENGLEK
ncbi:hypothetical protein UNPF46_30660 [Bradyrhizobium sp. UNPF46]|uniref:hypothetical protein n=1 Tax=Bradyrhizobium sp. UNPF46 TaxID=1141168 RepID=UPI00114F8167|nr:hypothetical protein [Bradyrhizobium sp. UNPF46]TQF27429.1 hypothetical protein UNPF46_30660 [Bradyrhizobium sp. UNPF46]